MGILHGILNPHFADWPHLYFYLSAAWLAPFRLIGLVSDPASGYLGVRVLDALLGSLTVLLVFEFGRRAYGWLAGFLGAAALAVAFLHVRDSHFGTLDIPLTLACTAGLYVAYRTLRVKGLRPLLLNGLILGVAASLKYNGALVFAAMATGQTLRARAERIRWIRLVGRLALIAGIGVVVAGGEVGRGVGLGVGRGVGWGVGGGVGAETTIGPTETGAGFGPLLLTALKVTVQVPAGSVVDPLQIWFASEPPVRTRESDRPATDAVTLVAGAPPP